VPSEPFIGGSSRMLPVGSKAGFKALKGDALNYKFLRQSHATGNPVPNVIRQKSSG
jgi:hypothetical protein